MIEVINKDQLIPSSLQSVSSRAGSKGIYVHMGSSVSSSDKCRANEGRIKYVNIFPWFDYIHIKSIKTDTYEDVEWKIIYNNELGQNILNEFILIRLYKEVNGLIIDYSTKCEEREDKLNTLLIDQKWTTCNVVVKYNDNTTDTFNISYDYSNGAGIWLKEGELKYTRFTGSSSTGNPVLVSYVKSFQLLDVKNYSRVIKL